jgi:hypothetical protein
MSVFVREAVDAELDRRERDLARGEKPEAGR